MDVLPGRVPAILAKYKPEVVGSSMHRELWVPSEDLEELNKNIAGKIDVIHELRPR